MTIQHENNEKNGIFTAIENNTEAGRMTYIWTGTAQFTIDHTEVNPDFKGRGVGKEMVIQAVAYARENNLKIVPLCPFAKAVFDKTTDLKDVLF